MSPLAQLFLVVHVLGAIAVFGPTFIFPLIARAAARAPQHGHFAAELSERIETRVVVPGALVQGLTGLALIATLRLDLTIAQWRYLIVAIVLYAIAVLYAVLVQAPAARRMVELTGAAAPTGAGTSSGPSPELVGTARTLQRGGMLLTTLVVVIVVLMVVKPTIGS
jgi:predicted nucleic acid-binding Zn ribbon protein